MIVQGRERSQKGYPVEGLMTRSFQCCYKKAQGVSEAVPVEGMIPTRELGRGCEPVLKRFSMKCDSVVVSSSEQLMIGRRFGSMYPCVSDIVMTYALLHDAR